MKLGKKSVICGLCIGLAAFATQARALTIYADTTSFNAATGAVANAPLPNLGNVGTTPTTVGDLTFTGNLFFGGAFDWSTLLAGNDLAVNGAENFTVDFAAPVYAFGFDVHEPTSPATNTPDSCNAPCFDTDFMVEAFAGMTSLGSFTFNPSDDAVSFVGFSGGTAFDRVVITDLTGTIDNEFFNGFRYATIPIVESSTLALFGLGLAGIGLASRRRTSNCG